MENAPSPEGINLEETKPELSSFHLIWNYVFQSLELEN